jgi:hypothetical protein
MTFVSMRHVKRRQSSKSLFCDVVRFSHVF